MLRKCEKPFKSVYAIYLDDAIWLCFICGDTSPAPALTLEQSFAKPGFYIFFDGSTGELDDNDFDAVVKTAVLCNSPRGMFWRTAAGTFHAVMFNSALKITQTLGMRFEPYSVNFYGAVSLADSKFLIGGGMFGCRSFNNGASVTDTGIISFDFNDSFAGVGAGMYWSVSDDGKDARLHGFVKNIFNGIFVSAGDILFHAALDPMCFKNSLFAFSFRGESAFTNIAGKPLTLSSGNDAVLCPERRALYRHAGGVKNEWYLGFCGTYSVSGSDTFLCGLSGTEYVKLPKNPSITFIPGKDSYVCRDESQSNTTCAYEFKSYTTCAYIKFSVDAEYYCQPSETPFFTPAENRSALGYMTLRLLTFADAPCVPVIPVYGTDVRDRILPVELTNHIYQTRFDTLSEIAKSQTPKLFSAAASKTLAVTRSGLLAGIGVGDNLEYVTLAVNNQKHIRLTGIDQVLRNSLQDANCKILFAAGTEFLPYCQSAVFTFDSWKFDASPAKWKADTFILLKYSTDVSIADYLETSGVAEVFSAALERCYDGDRNVLPHYKHFFDCVKDINFTGMLIIGCPVTFDPPSPDPMPALTQIINALPADSSLYAHHLIVQGSKVEFENGGLSVHDSAVYAVIDYDAEAHINYNYNDTKKDYDFCTAKVFVEFKNNALTDLVTSSELLINKLFNVPVSKSGEGGNCLLIDGSRREIEGETVFAYSLRSAGEYTLGNSVLEKAVLEKVTFTGNSFEIGGTLHFVLYTPDLFGYGGEYPLAFDGLRIVESSNEKVRVYTVSYANLALLKSAARPDSFPAKFPASAGALVCENVAATPADLGMVQLNTAQSAASVKEFSAPWFRLEFPLLLGDLGNLSGNAPFGINVALCWCGDKFYAALVPPLGVFGAGMRMSHVLEFSAATVSLEDDKKNTYSLKFNGIALRILGLAFPQSGGVSLIICGRPDGTPTWKTEYKGN
jgi:hypothetical protein